MNKKKKNKIFRLIRKLILALIILLPLLFIGIMIWPVNSTYSISVNTEIIEFKTLDDNISKIPLSKYEVFNYDNISLGHYEGTFKIAEGATARVERIANSNSASIQIQGKIDYDSGKESSAGTFYNLDQDEVASKAENFLEFYIDSISQRVARGETIIIPVTGDVSIGRAINYESYGNSNAIVRSGKVTVIGEAILGETYFKSESYDLNLGDQFKIGDVHENDSLNVSKAYGFVTINENNGMTAAYKVIGKKGRIITPGPIDDNSGYLIKTSLMSRFLHDPIFNGISLALAFLVIIAELVPFIQSIYPKIPKKKKK